MRTSNVLKLTAPAALAAAMVLPSGLAAATTATDSPQPTNCAVVAVGSANTANQAGSRFTVQGGVVSSKVKVTDDDECRETVTLVTWQAPDGNKGLPYSAQKLFQHTTKTFAPGVYSISTKLPDCFFQVDLVRGSQPTDPNGGPLYGKDRMMGSLHGGTQACADPTPSVTPTPSASPTPSSSPSATPAVLGDSTQPPTTLPDTGAALGGLVGVGSMVGAGYAYIRSRRPFMPKAK
jgi:hypothetical protein